MRRIAVVAPSRYFVEPWLFALSRGAFSRGVLIVSAVTFLTSWSNPQGASAHQDPTGCSATGVSLMVETFRADRQTPILTAETATECESISYRVVLAKPASDTVCAFEQGTLSLRTPDGVVHDLTPRNAQMQSLIPCLGGSTDDPALSPPFGECDPSVIKFESGFVDYTVRPQDVNPSGVAVALAQYANGLLHINANNFPNSVNGSSPIPARVGACPPDTQCQIAFSCVSDLGDGVCTAGTCTGGNVGAGCNVDRDCDVRIGLCAATVDLDGTPCDDGVFCNGEEICRNGECNDHAGDPCAGGFECATTCNESTRDCSDPAGSTCSDDSDPCTEDVCNGAGSCVHTFDATRCSLAECVDDLGVCAANLSDANRRASQCNAALNQCRSGAAECSSDLTTCEDDLAECRADDGTPDDDGDGEVDVTDRCPDTPADTPVDDAGCSLDQFCASIDVTTTAGRRACMKADFRNDEPAMRRRDADCTIARGSASATEDRCVPNPG